MDNYVEIEESDKIHSVLEIEDHRNMGGHGKFLCPGMMGENLETVVHYGK